MCSKTEPISMDSLEILEIAEQSPQEVCCIALPTTGKAIPNETTANEARKD